MGILEDEEKASKAQFIYEIFHRKTTINQMDYFKYKILLLFIHWRESVDITHINLLRDRTMNQEMMFKLFASRNTLIRSPFHRNSIIISKV